MTGERPEGMSASSLRDSNVRPQNVGIHALDIYFPKTYVSQEKLEAFSGVPQGKFTIGLGQDRMAFVNDREDVYSMALTVVQNLMQKYDIGYDRIGRLEVATETIMDHSKSVKSTLMQLFESSGNTEVEGIDSLHACYAGTSALFNSVAWVESSNWDGRYALVVVADIAEYAQGPARPTGGAGAVAMLIGADAPIVLERGIRSTHMEHAYDFYKPNLSSPYPVVDGHFSNLCYLKSLDTCYNRFTKKFQDKNREEFSLDSAGYVLFHAPYNKLVQKSFARLAYNDFLRHQDRPEYEPVREYGDVALESSYDDRALQKAFANFSKSKYQSKAAPATTASKCLGNMYTASLYAGLVSLFYPEELKLAGARILMFSYGSGLASSMFSLQVRNDAQSKAALQNIQNRINLRHRLDSCTEMKPEVFAETLLLREKLHVGGAFKPSGDLSELFPNTFYLTHKDDKSRRFYERTPSASE